MWYAQLDASWISHVFIYEWFFLPGCLFAVLKKKCFMIGVNVWWVCLAPENIPSAAVLTLGSKAVLCVCTQLQCCGVNNYSDWFNIRAWPTEQRVPDSCCKQPEEGCGRMEPRFWFEQVSVRFPPSASHSAWCSVQIIVLLCPHWQFFFLSPWDSNPAMPLHYRKEICNKVNC